MRLILLFFIGGGTLLFTWKNLSGNKTVKPDEIHDYLMEQLHRGNYDSIPALLDTLYEAHKKAPEDALLNADLGFVHLWRFSERARNPHVEGIEKSVYLSDYYFRQAIKHNPEDARLKGFQAGTEICKGALMKDLATIYRGYVKGYKAIKEWPEFNKFAVSLVSSPLGRNSFLFRIALKYQWDLINDCSCKDLDKRTVMDDPQKIFGELVRELEDTSDQEIKRVCWNTGIAPHNFEGFLLNFGDMLVKDGDIRTARSVYEAAKLSPTYNDWKYRQILEARIREAELNEHTFNERPDLVISEEPQLFINSSFSCVGCHQMGEKELVKYKDNEVFNH